MSWQNPAHDAAVREAMIPKIINVLQHLSNTPPHIDITQHNAKALEPNIYMSAASLAEYMDEQTLRDRVVREGNRIYAQMIKSKNEMNPHELMKTRLIQMYHVSICTASTPMACAVTTNCAVYRNMYAHATSCTSDACPSAICAQVKAAFAHQYQCTDQACDICVRGSKDEMDELCGKMQSLME